MASTTEQGVEYVVLWDWETEVPNNRYRERSYEDAVVRASGQQGTIAGTVGSTKFPAYKVLRRIIERTTITTDWKDVTEEKN